MNRISRRTKRWMDRMKNMNIKNEGRQEGRREVSEGRINL